MRQVTSTSSFDDIYASLATDVEYLAQKLTATFLADINREMTLAGIGNTELAKLMNVSPAYITKLFRGPVNPSVETLVKLANAVDRCVHVHLAPRDVDIKWWGVVTRSNQDIGVVSDVRKYLNELQTSTNAQPSKFVKMESSNSGEFQRTASA